MKRLITAFVMTWVMFDASSQIYMAKNAKIRFFSSTPIEDIEAVTNTSAGAINVKTGRIFFKATMKSFKFEKALMQEHFNENYVESDKYPNAEYDGVIQTIPDFKKDGVYELQIKGNLTLHGVKTPRDIKATFKVVNGKIESKSVFLVPCRDHSIKIPNVTRKNISDNIEVTVNAEFILKV